MNIRENILAIYNYEKYDRMPILYLNSWKQTIEKWVKEGHLKEGMDISEINKRLGFDCTWQSFTMGRNLVNYLPNKLLYPEFKEEILEQKPDGTKILRNKEGVTVLKKDGANGIPSEVEHLLVDRESWEKHYLPRLQFSEDRFNKEEINKLKASENNENVVGFCVGSLYGMIRNWAGLVGLSYIQCDDRDLFYEMIDVVGDLCYKTTEYMLKSGVKIDILHFWEDICYNMGSLLRPSLFEEKVGPHYKRISELAKGYGVNLISVDSDGKIDELIPGWINNGVNIMLPIEYGTWAGNIKPWKEKYGKELRGMGGMQKALFATDYSTIDKEIERLKPLVDLGGYIPTPDHAIPPDAKFENVQYYCDRMRKIFG